MTVYTDNDGRIMAGGHTDDDDLIPVESIDDDLADLEEVLFGDDDDDEDEDDAVTLTNGGLAEKYADMMENAEDYGFILRYPKSKIDVTGVIYESWHWRFVGINTAKEINKMGVTLEEYVEIKNIDWKSELN